MNAYRDENSVPTLIASSLDDGTTTVRILANPSTHALFVNDAHGAGGDAVNGNAPRDGNNVPVFMAVSSEDGFTPVQVYADAITGKILTDSN